MKLTSMTALLITILLLPGCGNNKGIDKMGSANTSSSESKTAANSPDSQQGDLVGEWEQQYTYFDKNGNYKLEPEEKQPSNTRLGFDWFRFNADGSCLRDKEVKFKSTYEIQNKGNTKELVIHNVHGYTITELTDQELILGAEGAFIVFKRIK